MSSVYGGAAAHRLAQAVGGAMPDHQNIGGASGDVIVRNRAMIGRYFLDLRAALRLSPQNAALRLQTLPAIIDALEAGRLDDLPPWPEVVRLVMTYATMAGIEGRPVLAMMSDTMGLMAYAALAADQAPLVVQTTAPAAAAPRNATGARFRNAVAAGTRRLPQDAYRSARARPDRAFYALSLPLGLMVVALNTSSMSGVLTSVSDYFRVHFAEVREGHRWIEVSDPRSRRTDKLQVGKLQVGGR